MATILTGYAYHTDRDKDGLKLSAPAFNPDCDVAILKDHEGAPIGHLLNKRHDGQGLQVDVLVFDDALAEKVRGFSIGTTKGLVASKATGKPLKDISCCVDLTPRNDACSITSRKPADPMQVNLALYGQKLALHQRLITRAVAALATVIDAHLAYARGDRASSSFRFSARHSRGTA